MAVSDQSGGGPPPGWYPDPWYAGGLRWWDGRAWGPEAGPAAGPTPQHPGAPGDPRRLLGEERSASRVALTALLAGAVAYAVLYVVSAVLYHSFFHSFFHQISVAQTSADNGGTAPVYHPPTMSIVGSLGLQLVDLGLLAVGVIFLVWMYRAAEVAHHAGLPARRSPGLAVAGFVIPIVSLWWPYQSVCDLFPPGDPRRRGVGRWWGLWLGTQFVGVVVFGVSLVSLPAGIILALGAAALACAAAMAARQVVSGVLAAHEQLVVAAVGSA